VRGRGLVDNLAAPLAIDDRLCRQEPLRLAAFHPCLTFKLTHYPRFCQLFPMAADGHIGIIAQSMSLDG
jgi:hypothetical protein